MDEPITIPTDIAKLLEQGVTLTLRGGEDFWSADLESADGKISASCTARRPDIVFPNLYVAWLYSGPKPPEREP